MQQIETEWATLKNLVKQAATEDFTWCTGAGWDRLQLGYVAAIFQEGGGEYKILFDRSSPNWNGIFPDEKSPISTEEWELKPMVTESSVVWSIPKLHRAEFSSKDLAGMIVSNLRKYHEDYKKASMLH